jgi:CheY-like chemotaxis protein
MAGWVWEGSRSHVPSDDRALVLIVDDDAEIRHVLRLLFEFEDFDVTEASTGTEAVARALKDNPDVIVLDYKMPGMMGDKTAEVLRSLVPEVRIVAFSAVLQEKPAWADAYLNKDRIGEIAPLLAKLVSNKATG